MGKKWSECAKKLCPSVHSVPPSLAISATTRATWQCSWLWDRKSWARLGRIPLLATSTAALAPVKGGPRQCKAADDKSRLSLFQGTIKCSRALLCSRALSTYSSLAERWGQYPDVAWVPPQSAQCWRWWRSVTRSKHLHAYTHTQTPITLYYNIVDLFTPPQTFFDISHSEVWLQKTDSDCVAHVNTRTHRQALVTGLPDGNHGNHRLISQTSDENSLEAAAGRCGSAAPPF